MKIFAYFGRLEPEKGFDLFLEAAKIAINDKAKSIFLIFGKGSLAVSLPTLMATNNFTPKPGNIYYFGEHDFDSTIAPLLKKFADYTVVPSRFIETFGLTALESINLGIPVIGSLNGGLEQFIRTKEAIKDLTTENLLTLIRSLPKPDANTKEEIKKLAAQFSTQNWLKEFKKITPQTTKKILIVSDFLSPIGGTEKHIQQITKILKQNNYIVEVFGSKSLRPSPKTMLQSLFNFKSARQLRKKITNFNPDLIWCHSVMRYLGRESLKVINQDKNSFKMITHHDLGLFTAKPSKLESISQIGNSSPGFLFKKIFIINPLIRHLRKFDLSLVPSQFLEAHVAKKLPQVKTFPHFI